LIFFVAVAVCEPGAPQSIPSALIHSQHQGEGLRYYQRGFAFVLLRGVIIVFAASLVFLVCSRRRGEN